MKKTLRILSLLLIAAMLFAFAACNPTAPETPDNGNNNGNTDSGNENGGSENENQNKEEAVTLNVGVLKGPTGVGAVSIADKASAKKNGATDAASITKGDYDIEFYETTNVGGLQANIINGSVDIGVVPINAASVLYNKTNGGVKVIAVNALGVLSIVGTGEYENFAALKGATIHTINQGATPEHILRYVLTQNGINPDSDVTLKFYPTPAEAVAKALSEGGAAMIPEPAVTSMQKQNAGLKVLFNMTEEWDKVSETKLVQGVLIARKEIVEKYPNAVKTFVEEYTESVNFVNNNRDAAAESIVKYGIVPAAPIAKLAIPGCNVVCYNGNEMQADVNAMLTVLHSLAPQSVGGKVPDASFYYIIEN